MNNYEYLKTLPPEQLIKYLTCKACNKKYYDEEQDKCFCDCEQEQLEWLNEEVL